MVFDLRQSDPLVASIIEKRDVHGDEVTVVQWIKDSWTAKRKYIVIEFYLILCLIADRPIKISTS
jgi:hypothetical protein